MKKKVFREYDIRGVVGEDFSLLDVTQLGKAFASVVREEAGDEIVIGRDGRLSSPEVSQAFLEGLTFCGAKVIDLGLVPTPLLYFANYHLRSHGAVMITGSHNPPSYNGFKMMVGGKPFCGQNLQYLHEVFLSRTLKERPQSIPEHENWSEKYLDFLLQDFKNNYSSSNLKVAWDTGNGAAGDIVERLIQKLPGTHHLINAKIDGAFPSHHPDPTQLKNMKQLYELVKEGNFDFGIGFDGDGDRIGVIDPQGRLVLGDQLLQIFAEEVLQRYPGAFVLADIKSRPHSLHSLSLLGARPVLSPTGHSHIKLKMKELNAPLAGETSGHIMFADRAFGFDDAIYAAIRLIGIVSKMPISFKEWVDRQPPIFSTNEIHIPSEKKFQQMEFMKELLRQENKEFLDIDGIRRETQSGWWLVRASNTQDILVIKVEADSEAHFEALLKEVEGYLSKIDLSMAPFLEFFGGRT